MHCIAIVAGVHEGCPYAAMIALKIIASLMIYGDDVVATQHRC
jgi:hypothetical protein